MRTSPCSRKQNDKDSDGLKIPRRTKEEWKPNTEALEEELKATKLDLAQKMDMLE